jgi:hypothetical protein
LNGVTSAVNEPRKFVLAAMDSSERAFAALCCGPIHIGSEVQAKGPRSADLYRYMAAILPRCWRRHAGNGVFLVFCPHIQSNRHRARAIE